MDIVALKSAADPETGLADALAETDIAPQSFACLPICLSEDCNGGCQDLIHAFGASEYHDEGLGACLLSLVRAAIHNLDTADTVPIFHSPADDDPAALDPPSSDAQATVAEPVERPSRLAADRPSDSDPDSHTPSPQHPDDLNSPSDVHALVDSVEDVDCGVLNQASDRGPDRGTATGELIIVALLYGWNSHGCMVQPFTSPLMLATTCTWRRVCQSLGTTITTPTSPLAAGHIIGEPKSRHVTRLLYLLCVNLVPEF